MKRRIAAIFAITAVLSAVNVRADWITKTIIPGSQPRGVAVNPVTNKIYVTNENSGNVTVIDGVTNATTTVSCGSWPQGIEVNPVTNQIYLVNAIGNTATIIDGATNDTSVVPIGSSAYTIAVNPATNKAYAVNGGSNTVTVIDGSTLATTTVAVGSSPRYAAVNPVTNKIYVVNRSGNSISVIDGETNTATTVAVGSNPQGVVVNTATNKIYVANYNSNTITEVDGATNDTVNIATAAGPGPMAVNPVTNKIYVGCSSSRVMVIDGASRDTIGIGAGTFIGSIAVNPVTNKIYVVNSGAGASLLVINGQDNTTTTITSGTMTPFLRAVAVNPVTNKIYIPVDRNDGVNYNVTVVDGASNSTAAVTAGSSAREAAVNPVTNKIYVANEGGSSLTVIDGASNATTNLTVGNGPWKVAVNPVTNRIYVGNYNSNSITAVNGATNGTTTLSSVAAPSGIAVNPVTNRIYVTNYSSAQVTVINGWDNSRKTVSAGTNPRAIAVNPVTNKVYAANYGGNSVTVIDGASLKTATVATGSAPSDVAVNPVTNRIYVANYSSNNVTVINGSDLSTSTVSAGTNPTAVTVNQVTNRIYVANSGSNNVTVINGSDQTASTVSAGSYPAQLKIDPVANKIYVSNHLGNSLSVIDGATNSVTTVSTGSGPYGLAANPVTGKVYVPNSFTNTVTVLEPVVLRDSKVWSILDSLSGNLTYQPQPALTGRAVNRWEPYRTGMMGVVNDRMAGQHEWNWTAGPYSGSSTDSIGWAYNWGSDSLQFGENFINAVPLEMQAGGTNNTGIGSAMAGNMLTHPFYYLDSIPPEQVALISPAINAYISGSSTTFHWHEAKDNYDIGHYNVQISANDSFLPAFIDTTVYDTSGVFNLSTADSIYHWRVRAVDACGNVGQFSETWNLELDVNAPLAPTLLTPSNHAWLTSDTAFCTWAAVAKSGKASPVYYVFKAYDLSDTVNPIKYDTTYNTADTVNVSEGRYRWLVEAHDQAGNPTGISGYYGFGYDVTPPSDVMPISPADSLITDRDSVVFFWHPGSDSISGMRDYKLQYAYDQGFASGLAETTLTDTSITLALVDSNYYWRVMATDTAGNSNYSESWYFSVDTQDPAVPALLTPADNAWLTRDTAFCAWTAVSKKSKASAVYYVLKAYLMPDTINPVAVDTTYQTSDTLVIGQGRYRWLVEAHDEAGNPPGISGYDNFGRDNVPPSPVGQIDPSDSLITDQGNVNFCWHPSADAVSGIREYAVVYAYDESFSSGVAETTLTDTSIVLSLPDSIYYWMVEARDSVGNVGVSFVWRVNVDTHDPSIPEPASPSDSLWIGDTIVVCAWNEVFKKTKASKVTYIIQLDINDIFMAPIIEDTTVFSLDTFSLSEGRYYWRVMAYDAAGNYGEYSSCRTFGIDATAPDIQYVLDLPDDNLAPYGPYEVTGKVSDLSGVKSAWMFREVNGGGWDSTLMFLASDSLRDSIPELTPAADETLSVSYYIKAMDLLGHMSTSSSFSFNAVGPLGVAGDPGAIIPGSYALNGAFPNPSRGSTVFKYQLPRASDVRLEIYNVAGQLVKTFEEGMKPAGYHQIHWESRVANGVYIYRLKAGSFTSTKKMMMVR